MARQANDYKNDWIAFIREILGCKPDREQRKIINAVKDHKYVTVRSGHARGKDWVAAVIANSFLHLLVPSTVIVTSASYRQVIDINMMEITQIHRKTRLPLQGELLTNRIKIDEDQKWFLEGFKSKDKDAESWGGYHNVNILVIVSEASSMEQVTYNALRGLMSGGNAKLLLVGNPFSGVGPFYDSFKDPKFIKFRLNSMNSPNVRSGKTLIPGQVDREWVEEMINDCCDETSKQETKEGHDFKWNDKWYKPDNLFITKVLGDYGVESEDQLVPLSWIEQAHERWRDAVKPDVSLRLGVDVAGMGRDKTIFCYKYDNYIERFESFFHQDQMVTVGKIKNAGGIAFVDTIGEGAGVHSRLRELNHMSVSVKFGESGKGLTDITGQRTFADMVSYLCWCIRDALNPKNNNLLALPQCDELTQDLTKTKWDPLSDGRIKIEKKEKTKERLKRSPDYRDALANTFYPKGGEFIIAGFDSKPELQRRRW